MKIAITGASGFVGSNLIKRLEVTNHIIKILRQDLSLSKMTF